MDRIEIELVFKTAAYKEIKQDRAFNIESFIGNVGGYVGLFLGFAYCVAIINKLRLRMEIYFQIF